MRVEVRKRDSDEEGVRIQERIEERVRKCESEVQKGLEMRE